MAELGGLRDASLYKSLHSIILEGHCISNVIQLTSKDQSLAVLRMRWRHFLEGEICKGGQELGGVGDILNISYPPFTEKACQLLL